MLTEVALYSLSRDENSRRKCTNTPVDKYSDFCSEDQPLFPAPTTQHGMKQ